MKNLIFWIVLFCSLIIVAPVQSKNCKDNQKAELKKIKSGHDELDHMEYGELHFYWNDQRCGLSGCHYLVFAKINNCWKKIDEHQGGVFVGAKDKNKYGMEYKDKSIVNFKFDGKKVVIIE